MSVQNNNTQIKEINDCSVCLEDLNTEETKTIELCKHVFHKTCLEKWEAEKKSCPICRRPIISMDMPAEEIFVSLNSRFDLASYPISSPPGGFLGSYYENAFGISNPRPQSSSERRRLHID